MPAQVLLLSWVEGPEGVPSSPATCFDFFEVFAGRQALTRTMSRPKWKVIYMGIAIDHNHIIISELYTLTLFFMCGSEA